MTRAGKRWVIGGVAALVLVSAVGATVETVNGAVRRQVLKSNDLTGLRHEALALFPRGSRLADATAHLVEIGFVCEPMRRSLPDISAPAILCASNGRGYPDYPAINVTVSTRNGLVSEIEIWNIMARSDDDLDLAGLQEDDSRLRLVLSAENRPNS